MAKVHPRIRARFKEEARRIVSRDNAAKKLRRSQNTIGEIERAMVRAYELGTQADDLEIGPATDLMGEVIVDWLEIPPRSREVLSDMTWGFSQRYGLRTDPTPSQLEPDEIDRKRRWFLVEADGCRRRERGYTDGPVQKLFDMGLLSVADANPSRFMLTDLGTRTCRDYWIRSDRNDPDLPIQSLR